MTVKVSKPAINVREELADLRKPTGVAGEAMLRAETPQEQFNLIGAGRRRLTINGDMRIAQRGTSSTGVGSSGYYACDRWIYDGSSDAVFTMEKSTDSPSGFGNSFKVTTTTADSSLNSGQWGAIQQRFEGQDVQQLGFNTSNPQMFTVSFWVKSSIAGGYAIGLYYDDGSSSSKYTGNPYKIDAVNTWEYKTITFNAPSGGVEIANDSTTGLRLYFCLSAGTNFTGGTSGVWGTTSDWFVGQTANIDGTLNATFQITGVQLELGKVATPFEHRSYGEELALCQRFFTRLPYVDNSYSASGYGPLAHGSGYSSSTVYATLVFPTMMRAAPTVTPTGSFRVVYGNQDVTGGQVAMLDAAQGSGLLRYIGGSSFTIGQAAWISMNNDPDGGILMDAEL